MRTPVGNSSSLHDRIISQRINRFAAVASVEVCGFALAQVCNVAVEALVEAVRLCLKLGQSGRREVSLIFANIKIIN